MGPMLTPWTLLSGYIFCDQKYPLTLGIGNIFGHDVSEDIFNILLDHKLQQISLPGYYVNFVLSAAT